MGKDPAFLFYPNDYIGGTMGMTFEEKGAYIELLMLQFNRGHMTKHMIAQTVGQLWVKIEDKFAQDENGLYYNKRLDEEKIKRQEYTQSRRNNVSGRNQYTKKPKKNKGHKGAHMTSHMENENENENINEVVFPFDDPDFLRLWQSWKNYKKKEFKFNYKSIESEQAALNKLNNLSGHNVTKAMQIIIQSIENGWKGHFEIKSESQRRSKRGATIEEIASALAYEFGADSPKNKFK